MSKKIVLVGGCFDLIHFGHIVFLEKAKRLGNYLVVALESDENVKKLKGKERPIHTQDQRARMLKALKTVDQVIKLPPMKSDKEYEKLVRKVKPSFVAVTAGDLLTHKKASHAEKVGAKIVRIKRLPVRSTSQIYKKLIED